MSLPTNTPIDLTCDDNSSQIIAIDGPIVIVDNHTANSGVSIVIDDDDDTDDLIITGELPAVANKRKVPTPDSDSDSKDDKKKIQRIGENEKPVLVKTEPFFDSLEDGNNGGEGSSSGRTRKSYSGHYAPCEDGEPKDEFMVFYRDTEIPEFVRNRIAQIKKESDEIEILKTIEKDGTEALGDFDDYDSAEEDYDNFFSEDEEEASVPPTEEHKNADSAVPNELTEEEEAEEKHKDADFVVPDEPEDSGIPLKYAGDGGKYLEVVKKAVRQIVESWSNKAKGKRTIVERDEDVEEIIEIAQVRVAPADASEHVPDLHENVPDLQGNCPGDFLDMQEL